MGMNIMYSSHYSRHFAQRVKIEIAIIMSKISINSFYNWKPISILSSKQSGAVVDLNWGIQLYKHAQLYKQTNLQYCIYVDNAHITEHWWIGVLEQ